MEPTGSVADHTEQFKIEPDHVTVLYRFQRDCNGFLFSAFCHFDPQKGPCGDLSLIRVCPGLSAKQIGNTARTMPGLPRLQRLHRQIKAGPQSLQTLIRQPGKYLMMVPQILLLHVSHLVTVCHHNTGNSSAQPHNL